MDSNDNIIEIPRYESDIIRIREEKIKELREVLNRRLGKERGEFLLEFITGRKPVDNSNL